MLLHEECTNKWKPWFAWYPVRLQDGRLLWLETVQRKMYYYNGDLNLDRHCWMIYRQPTK